MDDVWWLQHIFGESLAATTNPVDAKLAVEVSARDALSLMTRLFSNCGSLLAPFTDQQVADGLVFLASAGESDWMYYIYDPLIDRQVRFDCIRSIEGVYRDCFAPRCRKSTLHLSSDTNPLNSVCFMWWDRFPSGGTSDANKELIEVMARALQIEHPACQESALHGLGHWQGTSEDRVHAIIDEWLAKHPQLPSTLRAYAEAARDGNVL
jgi:hypothetical protein